MKLHVVFVAGLCAGALAGACSVAAATSGLIFSSVTLEDGATDGDVGYYSLGNDVTIVVNPNSHEFTLIDPLKGKKVTFTLLAE